MTGTAVSAVERVALTRAREFAMRGWGRVSPNPLVGAVVLRGGVAISEGWHEGPGTEHAEAMALRLAGEQARGATVVCTLEPCSHQGRTPPCANALVAAGVARVVIGSRDPLEENRAGGVAVLADAGVAIAYAAHDDDVACRALNRPFFTHALHRRPYVTLKLATSLDGRVATDTGETRWITGAPARERVHRWRAEADAVVVGIGTALADDPALTAREVTGEFRPPTRVVFDRQARLPLTSALVTTAEAVPVVVVVAPEAPGAAALDAAGVTVLHAADLADALRQLADREIQSIFLEGGPTLARSFLAAGLVDRVNWFVAPIIIGGDGAPTAIAGDGLGPLDGVPRLRGVTMEQVGDDTLISGDLSAPGDE